MGNIDQMTVDHILTPGFGPERCYVHARLMRPCQGYELLINELTPEGRPRDDGEWDDRE
jgi:hypothetical protein